MNLQDGRYALFEFKLGSFEIDEGAKYLCKIEALIDKYNQTKQQVKLRRPDLKIILTAGKFGYCRPDGVFVIPIGCLKD